MRRLKNKKAMTLIEIMTYFSVLTLVMGAVMVFAVRVMDMSAKSDTLHEVQANMDFITRNIVSAVQMAQAVDDLNSVFDADEGRLSLVTDDPLRNPTQYYREDGNIFVKYGADSAIRLNTDIVTCSKLNFGKLSTPKVPDQVKVNAIFETGINEMPGLDNILQINTSVSLRI